MITLQEFINLYEPETSGSFNIVLMATVSVGNISQTVRLGSYTIKNRECKELDMNTMCVEKFRITYSTPQGPSDTGMTIYVSDNKYTKPREKTISEIKREVAEFGLRLPEQQKEDVDATFGRLTNLPGLRETKNWL